MRLRHSGQWIGAVALGMLWLCVPALAGSELAPGDGSNLAAGDGSSANNDRLEPGLYPTDPVLASNAGVAEPYDPFFDVDWSVALRGSYTKSTDGERFDTLVVPSVSLEHIGSRSAMRFEGSAEVTRPKDGQIDVTGLRLGLNAGYRLDRETRINASGELTLSQDLPGTPGVSTAISSPPQILTGSTELGVTRSFGKFNVGVTGGLKRRVYGETGFFNGTTVDNSNQNYWSTVSTLRLGYQATPIFEVFGEAGLGRDMFDADSTAIDATTTTLRGGVTGRWNTTLEATASAGLGLRRFDNDSAGEIVTRLYDASITYKPDPTWAFTAGLSTNVEPPAPDDTGNTKVSYVANARVGYTVNSWLALRAAANWTTARFEGTPATETGYGYGLGADYRLNRHTALTADYGFDHSDSTLNGVDDAHRITMGVTISR